MPSPIRLTANSGTISQVNQTLIIDVLRTNGPLSKAKIDELTGLSAATVTRLTNVLLEKNVIAKYGQEPSTGGRPPLVFRYAGDSRVVGGIQLQADKATGILVDFDGNIIDRHHVQFETVAGETPGSQAQQESFQEVRLRRTLELFDYLLAAGKQNGTPCLSIGVSVPGVVSGADDTVERVPELGWPSLALGKILRQRTNIPVIVENDANALAFGELCRGAGQQTSTLIAVLLGNGLGAGIVANGKLHRGARSEAGEIGYMLMEIASLKSSYEDRGDLENRVGAIALTKTARERGLYVPAGTLITAHDILALAANQDSTIATQMADEVLNMIAIAVATMSVILDPEVIVLSSGQTETSDLVISGVTERLTGRILRVPALVPAALGENAVILGVAELAADRVSGLTYVAT